MKSKTKTKQKKEQNIASNIHSGIAYLRNSQTKVFFQRDLHDFYIVNLGTDLVHSISWRCGHNFVLAGLAKDAHEQVDSFVGPDAHKDIIGHQLVPSVGRIQLFEWGLVGIGVSLQSIVIVIGIQRIGGQTGRAVGIFVGIQQDATGIIVTSTSVGSQFQDIFAGQEVRHARNGFFGHDTSGCGGV